MATIVRKAEKPSIRSSLLPRVDDIEVFREDIYLVLYNDNRKTVLQLGKDISLQEALPMLHEHFSLLGRKQGREMATKSGRALPWSRSLEGGESAFAIDKKYKGETNLSERLWNGFVESLPARVNLVKKSLSEWAIVSEDTDD